MKKLTVALALSVLVVGMLLTSCATNHKVALSMNKGVVGKNGIPRPDWVIQDQSNSKTHYVSGYGSGKTFDIARQKAQLAADAELAIWISNTVEAVRERYVEQNTDNYSDRFLDRFVSNATESGRAVLSGVVEEDFWEDGEGGVWVLRSIKVENVRAQIDNAIATTCSDKTLFADDVDVQAVMARLDKVMDEYFKVEE